MSKFSLHGICVGVIAAIMSIVPAHVSAEPGAIPSSMKVEPPFWWQGMQSAELQLMIYLPGEKVVRVESDSESVTVQKIVSAPNVNYSFVDLELAKTLTPGVVSLTLITEGGEQLKYDYAFKQRVQGSSSRKGFSSEDVIYLVTPDRYANGDVSNDNVEGLSEKSDRTNPDGRHGGDLAGLENHVDYLAELGITKIWLNPLQQNNEPAYSYHGYSISDLYQIDARYGGNEGLLSFSNKARENGIGLIMDTIPNHVGINHWWLKDLPSKDWVNNEGKFIQTSHNHEAIQDPYVPEADKFAFNDGWFVPTMPDLNQRNPYLANYLIQNNIWWIEYAGLAGLRVDTLPYADKHFTTEFNKRILAEYPQLNIVGEEWSINPAIVAYWQEGKLNQDGYNGAVPSLMDFPLQDALIQALTEPEQDRDGLRKLHAMLSNDFQYASATNLVVIGDNHDMSRLHTQLGDDPELTRMALAFLMTTRGIPQLFYGTEILMTNTGTDAHGVIRSDFPGGWAGDKANAITGKGLSKQARLSQDYVRKLLNWRKKSPAIHHGDLVHYLPSDGIYVYFRTYEEQSVMVVMNKNTSEVSLELSYYSEHLNGKTDALNVMSGRASRLDNGLKVAAKSTQIFELK